VKQKPAEQDFDQLRRAAEAQLGKQPPDSMPAQSTETLLHELQVHHIELEMQNENLREAHIELEKSLERYVALYDLAPAAYLTLSREGLIEEANLSAAKLLGMDRKRLLKNNFNRFILPAEQDRWYFYLRDLQDNHNANLDLTLQHADGTVFYALLNCRRTNSEIETASLLLMLTDITERKLAEERLRLTQFIGDHAPDSILWVDQHACIVYANEAACREHGYTRAELLLMQVFAIEPEFTPDLWSGHWQELQQKEKLVFETKHKRKDGCLFPVEASANYVKFGENEFAVKFIRDISRRKQMESEIRIAAIAFDSQEGMFITDENCHILRINKSFTRITGYSADEIVGKNPRLLKSGRHDASFYAAIWDSINNTGAWQGEIWDKRKNGEIYPLHLTISAVRAPDGTLSNYVSTLTDITLARAAEEAIKRLAFYDPLTCLPNRRLLNDRLSQVMFASRRNGVYSALLFLDLDNFKTLNDTSGHSVGDLLLVEAAARLKNCVRSVDSVARFGGDEFVIILSELDSNKSAATSQAGQVAAKILAALSEPYLLSINFAGATATITHHCTASIGIAVFIDHEASQDEILKWADTAMYQAKQAGRNQIQFHV